MKEMYKYAFCKFNRNSRAKYASKKFFLPFLPKKIWFYFLLTKHLLDTCNSIRGKFTSFLFPRRWIKSINHHMPAFFASNEHFKKDIVFEVYTFSRKSVFQWEKITRYIHFLDIHRTTKSETSLSIQFNLYRKTQFFN